MGEHTLAMALNLSITTLLSQQLRDIISEISASVSNLRSRGWISLFGRSRHHSTEKVHIKFLLPGSK